MNPITNRFEPLSPSADGLGQLLRPDGTPVPTHWMQLSVGEVVTVKGCGFTVKYIGESTLLLEPVTPADVATELARLKATVAKP